MTDNANKPGDQRNDGAQHRPDKASETLSNSSPEVNAGNLRAAQKANPNRTDTVSPDGKSRFSLTDEQKPSEKQARAVQEKAYREAGLGDPHKPIGKPNEAGIDPQKIAEHASKALNKILESGKSAVSEGAKLWQGAHNGMHEFVDESVQSVSVARDYYGNALAGKVNLGADTKEFASAISKGVSQTLGTAGDYYFRQVPKGEANLGNDIGQASKAASDHWNGLSTEQKGQFIGKEVVPLLVPGAVGMVAKEVQGANLVAKAGEAITAFSSSEKMAAIEQKITQLQAHVQKFSELAKPLQPAYATVTDVPGRPHVPIETPKMDDGILMKHGDKGLPQGVKPSDKVTLSERFGVEGNVIPEIKVPEEVYKAAEKQGFSRALVDEKLEKLGSALARTHQRLGDYDPKIHGTERQYGTAMHELLRQNIGKDALLHTEESFLKGQPASWGKLGSSRPDVIMGDKNNPFASICLKTLDAVPSAQQERGWVRNVPRLADGAVVARLYLKLESTKR